MIDQRVLCSPQESILNAMARLNAMPIPKYVLVTNELGKLVGTVTDGDIRRAILGEITTSSPVNTCMNTKPICVTSDQRQRAGSLLKEYGITFVPVLDREGVVVDVVTSQRVLAKEVMVLVMAGGLGSRLHRHTKDTPKPMLHVAGKPILQRIVERLGATGFQKIHIAVNHLADQIIDFFKKVQPCNLEIEFLHEETRLGTAGALSLLPVRPTVPLLVINADLVTELDFQALLQFHFEHPFDATVGAAIHVVEIPYGILERDGQGVVTGIREKPRLDYFVNAGVYVLRPSICDLIPKNTFVDMPDVLNEAIEKGFQVGVFPIHEYWVDVGQHSDLAKARHDWAEDPPGN